MSCFNPAGFWLGFWDVWMFLLRSRNAVSTDVQKRNITCAPPFLKANLSRKTSSHLHPIFPYLSFQSQPTKRCLPKNVISPHHRGIKPQVTRGVKKNHDTNSNNPLFSGNSIKTTVQNYHNTTHLYRLLSFDPSPQDRYSHFLPIIMGLVSLGNFADLGEG